MTLQQVLSSESNTNSTSPISHPRTKSTADASGKSGTFVTNTVVEGEEDDGRDFQLFMEKARKEEKRKHDAILAAIAEADRRRRTMSMDPWSKKMGKF